MTDAHSTDDASSDRFVPTVSKEVAERIRAWHERAYREGAGRSTDTFHYLGFSLVVPPDVQPITPMSHLLGEAVLAEVRPGERVLDMGTGSGVNAVLAASKGARVVAVDINPHAVQAARDNAQRNDVSHLIDARQSDVFSAVDEVFDLIVFDPPFRWFRPRDLREAATTDENYRAMTRFFRGARQHLTRDGRMLISFGTSGDLGYLKQLFEKGGFQYEEVARAAIVRDDWQVDYFTFRCSIDAAVDERERS
ncbi:MAG TPA: methyltransferase [Actinomycetota bacterium]|nr:methyltransferase [Actinomycetota bacterium]